MNQSSIVVQSKNILPGCVGSMMRNMGKDPSCSNRPTVTGQVKPWSVQFESTNDPN